METVKKFLTRFKQKDLNVIVDNWSVFQSRGIDTSTLGRLTTKKKFTAAVLKLIAAKKVSKQEVAELDLIYISQWSFARKWTTYQLVEVPGSSSCIGVGLTAQNIEERLCSELKKFRLHNNVKVLLKNRAYWMRMEMSETGLTGLSQNAATYVVFYSGVPFLCVANLKAKYADFITQVLVSALKCKSVDKMELEGRCISSLLQIALKQHNQEIPASLHRPDAATRKRKKTAVEMDEEMDERIHDENWREKRRCKEYISTEFGEDSQPTLEFLEYRLETKCAGTAYAPQMSTDDVFHCTVRFEGTNVLAGLTQLVSAGLVSLPLPNYVANIRSLARNKIRLRTKSATAAVVANAVGNG